MGAPPFETGGVNEMIACEVPPDAMPIVGAPGTVAAMVIEKLCEANPAAFDALTVPVKSPGTVGTPLSTPLVAFNVRPVGSEPDERPNVGAGDPLAVYICEYP